jgi:hypothetical protein
VNADGTEHVVRVTGVKVLPDRFSLRIGDIAHNLRSTLDHVAYSVARTPNRDTSFPIWSQQSRQPSGRLIQPFIAGGTTAAVKRILKAVQPYAEGQVPQTNLLYLLRELDNVDKHRFVVTSATSHGASYHGFSPDPAGEWEMEPIWGTLEPTKPVVRFRFAQPNPTIKIDYRPILALSVEGVASALDDEDIVHGLWQMNRAVKAIAENFEPHLRR